MELVGKLSPKAMGWDRNRIGTEVAKVPADGGKVLLGRVAGIVTGIKETVNNETGDIQTGLKGSFKGISSLTDKGEVRSGVCYLPGGIQEMVEGGYTSAYEAAKELEPNKTPRVSVSFVMDLYAIPATNKAGYSFKAENIVDASAADPLDQLLTAASATKALPSPEAPATDKAPAKGKEKADA